MVEEEGEGATGLGAGAAGTPRDRTGTEPTSGEGVWPLLHSALNCTLQCTLFAFVLFLAMDDKMLTCTSF